MRFGLAVLLATAGLLAQAPAPAIVITNARVFTGDAGQPWAEAVAITGSRITAVGTSADVRRMATAATRVIDAGGGLLIPGINDAPAHRARRHDAGVGLRSREADGRDHRAEPIALHDSAVHGAETRRGPPEADDDRQEHRGCGCPVRARLGWADESIPQHHVRDDQREQSAAGAHKRAGPDRLHVGIRGRGVCGEREGYAEERDARRHGAALAGHLQGTSARTAE